MLRCSLPVALAGLAAAVEITIERGSTKVPLRPPGGATAGAGGAVLAAVDLAGQAGECESAQVVLRSADDLRGVTARMSALTAPGGGTIPAADWEVLQQGYVNCTASPVYHPSGGGWHPDPLLQIPPEGIALVPAGLAQPIYLTLCIPRDATPGTYSGQLALTGTGIHSAPATVAVAVEVWPLVIPTLRDGVFEGTWTFGSPGFNRFYPEGSASPWYPANVTFDPIHNKSSGVCCSAMQKKWFRFFEAHRTAADPYGGISLGPRSLDPAGSGPSLEEETSLTYYELMNASGSTYMFINDVTWCPGACAGAGTGGERCPQSYSSEFVSEQLAAMAPEVAALKAAGLLQGSYVYGGDECPSANRSGQMQMFAAVKARWPELRTKTSLQYAPDDVSLPVDTWAQTYMDFYCEKPEDWNWRHGKACVGKEGAGECRCTSAAANRAKRDAWQAAGKKYWWYWACQPTEPWLNPSLIEWPAIHGRLFFWLMALENVTGTHYWAMDAWGGTHVMGLGQINGTMLTDFDVWNKQEVVNGDGILMYPPQAAQPAEDRAAQGPLSSIRLENIRDGIEGKLWHSIFSVSLCMFV
jgi:hypothetical protein